MPKKIKVQGYIWTYEENFKQYKNEGFRELVKALLGYYNKEGCCLTLYGALNCEVELIEEQQDIDIQAIEELDKEIAYTNLDLVTSWSVSEKKLVKQQNQILKAIKQLDRREER